MENYITPDIVKAEILDNYLIRLTFKNKEVRIYDMKILIKENNIYKNLLDKEYFKDIKIRRDTIEWKNGEDVCPEELYYNSKSIKK